MTITKTGRIARFAAPLGALLPQAAMAAAPVATAVPVAAPSVAATAAASPAATASAAAGSYTPMIPTPGVGMPTPGGWTFQQQFSANGEYALWMHNAILMPVITIISLFVLGLLLWVVARYNRKANPVPSRTSHNTLLEVVWTLLPVLILVGIAVPSIDLLAKQYKPAPAGALTVKATGNQWFWTYDYPDNGGVQIISNMLKEQGTADGDAKPGERFRTDADGPKQLAVDNRLVLPVGEPIRIQTTGADVIHSFAVPSLWFKLDAVPGRINEKVLLIEKPGVYFGQCSELCGIRHGYMPIVVEALPRPQFNAWLLSQGGTISGTKPAAAPAAAAPAAAAPAAGATPASTASPAPTASASAAPAA
ncbi:cytochrome c oxidase subunit II [Parablastomonas sp. CN1-191]|uniref:cytochrome c oxidase subunit II n=1 Tax=Parablastomonas sp. CN1-191 TaxID=3400908 RepID=UPI003BF8B3CA